MVLTNVRCIFRNVGSAEAHAETHVGRFQGRRVVRAVPGGSHHLPPVGPAGDPLQTGERQKRGKKKKEKDNRNTKTKKHEWKDTEDTKKKKYIYGETGRARKKKEQDNKKEKKKEEHE